jgi:hypothetical protein
VIKITKIAEASAKLAKFNSNIIVNLFRVKDRYEKFQQSKPRTLMRFKHYKQCFLFSLLSMPTKLADGLGLRDALLFGESTLRKTIYDS